MDDIPSIVLDEKNPKSPTMKIIKIYCNNFLIRIMSTPSSVISDDARCLSYKILNKMKLTNILIGSIF